jgi:hypothetical protein
LLYSRGDHTYWIHEPHMTILRSLEPQADVDRMGQVFGYMLSLQLEFYIWSIC